MRTSLLGLSLLFLVACGDAPESSPPSDPAAAWSGTIAYEAGVKLGGCDVGDLDPAHPGNEIAAVAADGGIHLVHHDADGWHGAKIAQAPAEMIQCAIGDADPTRAGNELVVVGITEGTEDSGGKGAAHLVFREGDAWKTELLFEDSALIHGVLIADVHPFHQGMEVVTVGFSRKATVLAKVDGAWTALAGIDLPGAGKTAASIGGLVGVANTSDELLLFRAEVVTDPGPGEPGELSWDTERARPGSSQGRVAGDGKRFLVACDDGSLQIATPDGLEAIHKEASKLRGAVLADIDPLVEGIEAATAGYGKEITLLYPPVRPETTWSAVTLWRDSDKIHHLAGGEILSEGLGMELVAVGYSGRVIVCARTKR